MIFPPSFAFSVVSNFSMNTYELRIRGKIRHYGKQNLVFLARAGENVVNNSSVFINTQDSVSSSY